MSNRTQSFRSLLPLAATAVLLIAGCAKGDAESSGVTPVPPVATDVAPATAPQSPAPGAPAAAPLPGSSPGAAPQGAEPVLAAEQIPEIVARVDGKDVSKGDLLARAAEARGALAERGIEPPASTRTFFRSVLDDLIGNMLLYRELSAAGKAASEADVAGQLAAVRGQFPSEEAFDAALAQRGFDRARLQREISESLTVQKWVRETVVPSIVVSEAEAREFFVANAERMIDPESVRARHVLIGLPTNATPEARAGRRREAEEILGKLAGGADFAAVARESSDDTMTAPRGGELGWVARGQSVPAFEQAAFALEPGKLSGIVESRFGFHIVRIDEKKAQTPLAFEQARPRIEQVLKQRKLEAEVRAKLNELGAKAKVEILI